MSVDGCGWVLMNVCGYRWVGACCLLRMDVGEFGWLVVTERG